jgi:hypothetical protein
MTIKFSASDLESICRKLSGYVKPGNSYVLQINRSKAKRSLNQNRYYWGVIITLFSQSTGYSANEAHQTLACQFLRYDKDGKQFVKSTTELDTKGFENYAEQCRQFMWHELNVHVPLPNELTEEFLIQLDNIYNY